MSSPIRNLEEVSEYRDSIDLNQSRNVNGKQAFIRKLMSLANIWKNQFRQCIKRKAENQEIGGIDIQPQV